MESLDPFVEIRLKELYDDYEKGKCSTNEIYIWEKAMQKKKEHIDCLIKKKNPSFMGLGAKNESPI